MMEGGFWWEWDGEGGTKRCLLEFGIGRERFCVWGVMV